VGEAVLDDVGEGQVIGPLRALLAEIDGEYARRKRELGALDFTDLERETLALLDRLAARGRAPEGAPRTLLVDEYQDTNPLQVAILARLRRPAGGAPVPQFSVGDPKQSIYRFRRADVEGMKREWEALGEERRARLSESFRSRPGVVEFHNALFACLFAHGAGGVEHEPMRARDALFHEAVPQAAAEVLVVDAGADAGAGLRREAEARAIAQRVRAWCDGSTRLARREDDPATGAARPPRAVGYGDVAVLLRARSDVKAYERAFLEAGVPFHVGRGKGFFHTEEIADLLHLLRVVFDPGDRFAVAAWMTSPAVGATDAEVLAAFAAEGRPFDAVLENPRLCGAAEAVLRLRVRSATDSLEATVAAAIEASGAVATSLWQDGGARRARNLAKAVSIARRLDGEGVRGLGDYLRHLTDLRDREVDEPEAESGADAGAAGSEGGPGSVALLTVHAAKGLEWPFVVLADAGRKLGGHARTWISCGAEVAWRLSDPVEGETLVPGGLRALEREDARLEGEESRRLLYVALTRAGERVLVTMTAAGAKKTDGEPKEVYGWGKDVWSLLDVPFEAGTRDASIGDAPVRVTVESPRPAPPLDDAPLARRHGAEGVLSGRAPGADEATRARARELWRLARRSPGERGETLGGTPFVAAISDLLAFAESPRKYYLERHLRAAGTASPLRRGADLDDPGARGEDGIDAFALDVRGGSDEAAAEGDGGPGALDRTALGRAVHGALERFHPGGPVDDAVAAAVEAEFPAARVGAARAGEARRAATGMVRRFLGSATGRATAEALAAGRDVRREVAFHARIRFPDEAVVAGFSSLLVKGTIDLWLPTERGPFLYDHKTNSPRGRLGGAGGREALRAHYATQLRLYALAAERVLGQDVAGAALLLLDPDWGEASAVEQEVDVSGPRLLETRSLCRAFAVASLEDRWPEDWRRLL
jgi:ATP-dependent helicase/nuclease subunit A